MGNKLCKKKTDAPATTCSKPPTALDRIINKFSPKPKWKSDTNLEEKQVNSYQVNAKVKDEKDGMEQVSLSKSSDWTDVPLVVPEKVEASYGKNNNIAFNDDRTPIPPPRKKKSLRETLGSLIQYKKPVEEQVMVQKKINYKCPCCEDGFHKPARLEKKLNGKESSSLKEHKRRKTPSIASLPNYTDFKLTIAGETDVDKPELEKHSSIHSLPDEVKKNNAKVSADKIDNVLTRARSFGSLLPTMLLHKMSTTKAPLAEIESDDSLGGLDDWGGLNMIEHYKPRDSSLPRPRRPKTQEEMLADIEKQIDIVPIEEFDPPIQQHNLINVANKRNQTTNYIIPPEDEPAYQNGYDDENEHSSLMKILEKYSGKIENEYEYESAPPIVEHKAAEDKHPINDFLNAERAHFTTDFARARPVNNTITT